MEARDSSRENRNKTAVENTWIDTSYIVRKIKIFQKSYDYKSGLHAPSSHLLFVPPSDPRSPLTSSLPTWVPMLLATETAMSPTISAG